ncbi:hypothetical protein SCOR_31695 [Sulfidibacter corallicola]|uniref:DUF4390 domain-containing protein n=1 Tax=Sulfidibacter corallicola TaxID=2818388 RepID=A0A8A4TK78_SULCO|nr:hypothetical protein [Sulfidibacter corallicola]QTD49887.1 hypothetical protein J3U87_30260 [Sulfidibacter corallicola]
MNLVLLLISLWSVRPAPTVEARVNLVADARVVAHLPDSLFEEDEVRENLMSGLTTSLLILVETRDDAGRLQRGGARVDIRYELWDEQLLVTALDMSGQVQKHMFDDLDELKAWWRAWPMYVLPEMSGVLPSHARARIRLEVVPFSVNEQSSAQLWLSGAGGRAPDGVQNDGTGSVRREGEAGQTGPGLSARLINLMVATSVKRKPLLTFTWRVPITRP